MSGTSEVPSSFHYPGISKAVDVLRNVWNIWLIGFFILLIGGSGTLCHVQQTRAATPPDITVSEDSLNLGSIFVGLSAIDTLMVSNQGTDSLTGTIIVPYNSGFSVDTNSFALAFQETLEVLVTFSPSDSGLFSGRLTISSNDPDETNLFVFVEGWGVIPPDILVNPDSLSESLFTGGMSTGILSIFNTGESDLEFAASIACLEPSYSSKVSRDANRGFEIGRESNIDVLVMSEEPEGNAILIDQFAANISGLTFTPLDISTSVPDVEFLRSFDVVLLYSWDLGFANSSAVGDSLYQYVSSGGNLVLGTFYWLLRSDGGAGGSWGALETIDPLFGGSCDWAAGELDQEVILPHPLTHGLFSLYASRYRGGPATLRDDATAVAWWTDGDPLLAYNQPGGRITAVTVFPLHGYFGTISGDFYRLWENALKWTALGVATGWLSVEPASGTVPTGSAVDVQVNYDATFLAGANYLADIVITSNDPDEPQIAVPVDLNVTGAPNIVVSDDSLGYGEVLIGYPATDTVAIQNQGVESLTVADIVSDHSDYSVNITSFVLIPGERRKVAVTFSPSVPGEATATLTIYSDDPDDPTAAVALAGSGAIPADIWVSVDSLVENLAVNDTSSQVFSISNLDGQDLIWEISISLAKDGRVLQSSPTFSSPGRLVRKEEAPVVPSGKPDPNEVYVFNSIDESAFPKAVAGISSRISDKSNTDLEDVLENLNVNFEAVIGSIPNRFDFSDGEVGDNIYDGGDDMYDHGNYLSTDLGGYIPYSNDVIVSSLYFGAAGKYFTRKYPGLFILAADMDGVNAFEVQGNLGADGSGHVDGALLETTLGYTTFHGFLKRVYGTYDPSVNHLIIIQENPAATQEFSTSTDSDYHLVHDLLGTDRLYYLLYAGTEGFYIDNDAALNIMNIFLNSLGLAPEWVGANPKSGVLPAGSSDDITASFDASGLLGGSYAADLTIASNDPDESRVVVPVRLQVTGEPDVDVSADSLNFGSVFLGYPLADSLTISNQGTDLLTVSDISASHSDFSVDTSSFALEPEESWKVFITFSPSDSGAVQGTLFVTTDDPDEPVIQVVLDGYGVYPPNITVAPDSFAVQLYEGDSLDVTMTIANFGLGELHWEIPGLGGASATLRINLLSPVRASAMRADGGEASFGSAAEAEEIAIYEQDGEAMVAFSDLTGKTIGFTEPYLWHYALIRSNLISRGATVKDVQFPVTVAQLDSLDALAVDDMIQDASSSDIAAIRAWIQSGGGLLEQGKDAASLPNINALLSGTGISEAAVEPADGLLTNILPHPITKGVDSVWSVFYTACCSVTSPGQTIVFDNFSRPHVVVSALGAGKVVAVGNDILGMNSMFGWDTPILANQMFDWLLSNFLSAEPDSGMLAPGTAQDVTVRINARELAFGDYWDDIVIHNNDPLNSPAVVPVFAHVLGIPNLVLSDSVMDFGSHFVGVTVTDTLTVSNDGSDSLLVTDMASDNSDFNTNTANFVLMPGDSMEVLVSFTPSDTGQVAATLTIHSTDLDEPEMHVALRGVGLPPPDVWVSLDSLIDTLATGQTSIHTLTVSNQGGNNLIFDVSIPGTPDWVWVTPQSDTLRADSSAELAVSLDAAGMADGDYQTNLMLSSNDPDEPEIIIPIRLHVIGAPDVTVSDDSLDYGGVVIGLTKLDSLTVFNRGTEPLAVFDIYSDDPDFTVGTGTFALNPGDSLAVLITFAPTSVEVSQAVLTLETDDPDESSVVVHLQGWGLIPPQISVSPDSLGDSLFVNHTSTQFLTISNHGASDLIFTVGTGVRDTAEGFQGFCAGQNMEKSTMRKAEEINVAAKTTGVDALTAISSFGEAPSAGRGLPGGAYCGEYLRFGITDHGEIMPFQYPVGNEHLYFSPRYSGYMLSYLVGGQERLLCAGYDFHLGIYPFSFTELVSDSSRVVVEVVTRTFDSILQITRLFTFLKHDKYVNVQTSLENISSTEAEEVIFKSFANWDIDGDPEDDNWDYDLARNMIFGYDQEYVGIGSLESPNFMDIYGRNDYCNRNTFVDYPTGPVFHVDGMPILHFDLGDLSPGSSTQLTVTFAAADDLPELEYVMDRGLALLSWLSTDPVSGMVTAGSFLDLAVVFDAGHALLGDYAANIIINSNDPANLQLKIPVSLAIVECELAPFSLRFPPHKASTPRKVRFEWEPTGLPGSSEHVRYDLLVSTSRGFSPDSTTVDSNLTISQLIKMLNYGTYFWKVKAKDICGAERWSSQTWNFRVAGIQPASGDVNADGRVDVADAIFLVNYFYRSGPSPDDVQLGDLNCDGLLDVGDVVFLLNYLFKGGPEPGC